MQSRITRFLTGLVFGLMLPAVLPAAALAQDAYPAKPVTLVVPFPPGGVADVVARAISPSMERALKQPVIIINRPGAGGSIGIAHVAKSAPDGYTIMMVLASLSTIPEQAKLYNQAPAFTLDQLAPIARISIDPMLLAVLPGSPYKSLKDIVDDAKKRPGVITYASSGNFGVYHVATEMFTHAAGIKMRHVPYNGGAPALIALLGGQVDLGLVTRSVALKHLKAGTIRPLVAWGGQRVEQFPDLPAVKEQGYDVDYSLWSGLFGPTGMPAPVMKALRDATRAAIADPQFKDVVAKLEASIVYLDGPEFETFFARDAARLGKTVREIGRIE